MRLSLAFAFALAPLAAQTASASLTAINPLVVRVQDGPAIAQATQPSGLLGSPGQLNVSLPLPGSPSAALYWDTATGTSARVITSIRGSSLLSQVRSGPQEFLVEFTASAAVPAVIEIFRHSDVTAGVAWPSVQIDLDNNGSIEIPDLPLGVSSFTAPPTFGTQPAFVRVRIDAIVQGIGESLTNVEVAIRPPIDTQIARVALGCGAAPLQAYRVFPDRGIEANLFQLPRPTFFVVGLQSQPQLLPSVNGLPCLVVPAADFVLLQGNGRLHVPLPSTLRPITFWLQAIVIEGTDLLTTDAYRIDAF